MIYDTLKNVQKCFQFSCIIPRQMWEGTNTGLDYWTGTLEWTTGLTCFWFSHIFGQFN